MDRPTLNVATLRRLAALADSDGRKVRWALDDGATIAHGVSRGLVLDEDGHFPTGNHDVRDCLLRISSSSEHFIPVRDALELMLDGLLYVQED